MGIPQIDAERKPTRLETARNRTNDLAERVLRGEEHLTMTADRLFGAEPPNAKKESLQSVVAGEYNELNAALEYLNFAVNRLEETIERIIEQA